MASHLKRLKGSINKGTKEGSSPSSSSKPNPPSTDKVRLKCYYNGEITVLVVGLDIKYASLRKKIQDTFGRGVIIYQYEDHEGDRVTVHSKQDIKEAFGIYERLLVKRGKKQGYEPYLKVFLAQRNGTAPALSSSSLASSSSSSSSTAQQQSTPANPTAPSSLYSSSHSNNISEKRLSSDFVANDTGLDIVKTGSPPTPTMTDHTKKSKKGKVRRLTPSLSKVKDKESANSNNSLGSKSPQQSRSSKLPKRKKSSLTKQKPRLTVQTDFSVYGEGSQDSLAAQLGRADWESDPKILSRNYTPSKSALRTPPFLEASDFPSGEFVVPADHSHRLSPPSISSSSPSSLFPPSPALRQSSQPPALSSPDSHLPPTLFPVTVNTISADTLLTDLHVVEPPPLTAPTSHLPSLYLPSPPLSGPSSYNQSSVLVPPSPSSPRLSLSKKNRRANPDPPPLNSPTSHLPSRALSPSSLSEMLLFTSAPDTLPPKEEEAALPPIHTPTHLSEAEDSETADANGHYHNYESTDEYEEEDESDYTGESEEEEGNDDEDIDEDEVEDKDEEEEEEEGKDSPPDSDSEYEDERALLRSKPSIRRKNSKNRKSSRLKGKPLQQHSGGNGLRKNTTTNSSLQRLRTSSSDDPLYQLQQAAVQRVAPCDWSKVRWQRGPLIARGGFGDVYMGFKDGQFFAIKQIELQRADGKFLAAIQQEIEVMKTLNHPNIVRYLGTLQQDKFMNIFLEFIPGGSLQTLISRFGALNERTIRIYTRQVLLGLAYLHDNNIVHRDIKGANILVDLEGRAKLADFGCSKKLEGDRLGINKTILGTPWWMAPEVIRQSGHGSPADIWSLGCTVVEMATSKPPWSECTTVVAALWKISSSDKLPEIPSNLSDDAKNFLQACFKR
ncbi:mitogen-activated protein kinase kinase kinase NPK1, variant 2 [Balamuthia mandrillaris]